MAQAFFLSPEQLTQARELIHPPLMTPDGDVAKTSCFASDSFSHWLGAQLEELLYSVPGWKETQPIVLGSWARGEICPKSDIDLLFCGDEDKVKSLVDHFHSRGLKLRYRMPANKEDWTENVEAFDVLALLKAKPLTPEGAQKLFEQQKKIWARKTSYRRHLLKVLLKERAERARRHDSITNYLEPNIKFGPGGLRDLEQGLQIYELFSEKFSQPGHALDVLQYYRQYLLSLRQKLHLDGYGDILAGSAQFEMASWLGFKNQKDFMRDLQRGLSRVNFYSDWMVEVAESTAEERTSIDKKLLKKPADLSSALHKNSSTLMQKKVRENLDDLYTDARIKKLGKERGEIINKMLAPGEDDQYLVSVFRSRLIDKLVPEIRRLVGYVQHDQYHRFTADSHIMQACREAKRVYKQPVSKNPLAAISKKLNAYDWKVLVWTCLYHDLAKGLDHGAEHSEAGVSIVERDFKAYGFPKSFTADVSWMVKNHLELSQAAFRKNPQDPKLWQELREKGVVGKALYRLALFTVIDIRATNPEAWNDWKAKLLKELVLNLESQKAQNYFDFVRLTKKLKWHLPQEFFNELGPTLIETLSVKVLVEDLQQAESSAESLPAKAFKTRQGEIWIRFHDKKDRTGLLSDYVSLLYSLGLSVRHASIHTLPRVGVYDWFQVTTSKNIQQLTKILSHAPAKPKEIPTVKFESIQLVSTDEKEWVISFKGLDQSGFLAAAAKTLSDLQLSVQSARVHTWGRQVDDIFVVKAQKKEPQVIEALLQRSIK